MRAATSGHKADMSHVCFDVGFRKPGRRRLQRASAPQRPNLLERLTPTGGRFVLPVDRLLLATPRLLMVNALGRIPLRHWLMLQPKRARNQRAIALCAEKPSSSATPTSGRLPSSISRKTKSVRCESSIAE